MNEDSEILNSENNKHEIETFKYLNDNNIEISTSTTRFDIYSHR